MPFDLNELINPLHPKAAGLKIVRRERLRLDPRLLLRKDSEVSTGVPQAGHKDDE
ncbi:MAG TPA: hypothetical protein VF168_05060 [Trueperaceae bacterium]